jgi:hypothetical protein
MQALFPLFLLKTVPIHPEFIGYRDTSGYCQKEKLTNTTTAMRHGRCHDCEEPCEPPAVPDTFDFLEAIWAHMLILVLELSFHKSIDKHIGVVMIQTAMLGVNIAVHLTWQCHHTALIVAFRFRATFSTGDWRFFDPMRSLQVVPNGVHLIRAQLPIFRLSRPSMSAKHLQQLFLARNTKIIIPVTGQTPA